MGEDTLFSVMDRDFRLVLAYLLMMHPRLNVTEIASRVGKDKATVSRHLAALESAGVVKSVKASKRGNPKYFTIDQDRIEEFNFSKIFPPLFTDGMANTEFYTRLLRKLKAITRFFERSLSFVNVLQSDLEPRLHGNGASLDEEFAKYMFDGKLNFQYLFISENNFTKFKEIYADFRININKLVESPPNGENQPTSSNAIMFLDVLLPMKQLVDLKIKHIQE